MVPCEKNQDEIVGKRIGREVEPVLHKITENQNAGNLCDL